MTPRGHTTVDIHDPVDPATRPDEPRPGNAPKRSPVVSTILVRIEDVLAHHAVEIRYLFWQGRYNPREKAHTAMPLSSIAQTMNRAGTMRIEGKKWDIAVVAYVLAHPEFLPGWYLKVQPKPGRGYYSPRDRVVSYRCSHEEEGVVEHARCRCVPPCVCYCHIEGEAA